MDFAGVNHNALPDKTTTGAAAGAKGEADEETQSLHRNHGSPQVLNPCPCHPLNEIAYLDKTSKEGACEVCLPNLIRSSHELMPIKQTVNEVTLVLKTLDEQVQEMQQQKKFKLE